MSTAEEVFEGQSPDAIAEQVLKRFRASMELFAAVCSTLRMTKLGGPEAVSLDVRVVSYLIYSLGELLTDIIQTAAVGMEISPREYLETIAAAAPDDEGWEERLVVFRKEASHGLELLDQVRDYAQNWKPQS